MDGRRDRAICLHRRLGPRGDCDSRPDRCHHEYLPTARVPLCHALHNNGFAEPSAPQIAAKVVKRSGPVGSVLRGTNRPWLPYYRKRANAMLRKVMGSGAVLALVAWSARCRVRTEKGANGEDQSVQVDTPFGGVHVNTDQTTAADLGLPVYPGAGGVKNDNDKSADVHMGFGQWELRVKVVNYSTPDDKDKVIAFYKKALGRFGDVISCQDGKAVGTPTTTTEGLGCWDGVHGNVNVDTGDHNYGYHSQGKGFELKAGSQRHQHIVGFGSSGPDETKFALVA